MERLGGVLERNYLLSAVCHDTLISTDPNPHKTVRQNKLSSVYCLGHGDYHSDRKVMHVLLDFRVFPKY